MGFHSKPPKLSLFSGEEVPRKHEISFNRWLFEVRTIQQSYAEPLAREAIIISGRGQAADLNCFLGTNTDVEKIISKLETTYGTFCIVEPSSGSQKQNQISLLSQAFTS